MEESKFISLRRLTTALTSLWEDCLSPLITRVTTAEGDIDNLKTTAGNPYSTDEQGYITIAYLVDDGEEGD